MAGKIRKSNLHQDVKTMVTDMISEQALDSANFDSVLSTKTTDDITEGSTNQYYTTTRFDSDFSTGGSFASDVTFNDNVKAVFGDSSDLQIYHNSSNNHSYIIENGSGSLITQAENLIVQNTSGANNIVARSGAEVELFYNGAQKLETSSSGVNVSGRLQVSGGGTSTFDNLVNITDETNDTRIAFTRSDTGASGWIGIPNWDTDALKIYGPTASSNELAANYTNQRWSLYGGGSAKLQTTPTGVFVTGELTADSATIPNLSGDVTFTGNLQGPSTWYIDPAPVDSDAGLLVIRGDLQVDGTTTTVNSTTVSINDKNIVLADSAANAAEADGAGITVNGASATISYDASNDEWDFNKDVNITGNLYSSGYAGIGTTAPYSASTDFEVKATDPKIVLNNTGTRAFGLVVNGTKLHIRDESDNETHMTVTEQGNVGIGTTSPSALLHLYSSSNDTPLYIDTGNGNGAHLRFLQAGSVKHFLGCGGGISLGDKDDLTMRAYDNILFASGNSSTERMRITSNGDVSIGSGHAGFSGWRVLNMRQLSTGALINFEDDDSTRAFTFASQGSGMRYQAHIAGGYHRWETNATANALYITDGGNVGIGTNSPDTILHISSAGSPQIRVQDTTNDVRGQFTANDSSVVIGTVSNHSLNFATNNGNQVTLAGANLYPTNNNTSQLGLSNRVWNKIWTTDFVANGNVGIGTSSPDFLTTISSTTNAITGSSVDVSGLQMKIQNPNNADNEAVGLGFGLSTTHTNIGAAIIHTRENSESVGGMHFATKSAATASTDIPIRMTISKDGNVGIGTTSPARALEVVATDHEAVRIRSIDNIGSNYLSFYHNNGTRQGYVGYGAGGDDRLFLVQDKSNNIEFYTGGSTKMAIATSGNVGIGTQTPTHTLDVQSSIAVPLRLRSTSTAGTGLYLDNDRTGSKTFGILSGNVGAGYFNIKDEDAGVNRLVIDPNGNVGIGTTSPGAKLDVNGNLKLYNASSDPAGTAGDLYYNTTDKTVKFHNGNSWVKVTNDVTPDQLGNLYSWWDFGGTYSTIGSGNSTVSDASGNGYTLTEGGTCTTEAFPNGKNGIRVGANAGNHWYTSNAVPASGANARTLFAIFYNIKDTNLDPLYHVMHYGEATTGKAFGIVQADSGLYWQQHTWGGTGTTTNPVSYAMNQTGSAGIMIVFSIYTGSGGKLRIYDDGTTTGVNYTSSYIANTGNVYGMRIGSRVNETNSNEAGDVVMGECGAYTRELSDAEMDQLALGLLQRWT